MSIAVQPALIPSPADGSAPPINRIRTTAVRVSDRAVLREQRFDVSPASPSWALDIDVPVGRSPIDVVIFGTVTAGTGFTCTNGGSSFSGTGFFPPCP